MNTYYVGFIPVTDELYHHGIQGQKWGIRRYQNEDGSLTDAGMRRYYGHPRKIQRDLNKLEQEYAYAKGDEYRNQASYDRGNKKALKIYNKLTGKNDLFDGATEDMTRRFEESGLRNNKRWKKLVEKQNRAIEGMDAAVKRQQEIESETYKLMSKALEQKYSIISSPKMRDTVKHGNSWVGGALGGAIGGAIIGALDVGLSAYELGGVQNLQTMTNKHKVKNDGKQEAILVKRL